MNPRYGLGLAVAAIALSGCSGEEPKPDDLDAYIACENFIADRLRAPSTADFSGYTDSEVVQAGSRWTVAGHVDAENGFGAKIRSDFVCEMELSGTTWQLLTVGGL